MTICYSIDIPYTYGINISKFNDRLPRRWWITWTHDKKGYIFSPVFHLRETGYNHFYCSSEQNRRKKSKWWWVQNAVEPQYKQAADHIFMCCTYTYIVMQHVWKNRGWGKRGEEGKRWCWRWWRIEIINIKTRHAPCYIVILQLPPFHILFVVFLVRSLGCLQSCQILTRSL